MPSDVFQRLNSEKKQSILNGAKKEFSRAVFEETKVVNICRNANIPRATFYTYFDSLEDIFRYIYKEYVSACCFDNQICLCDNIDSEKLFINLVKSDEGLRAIYSTINEESPKIRVIYHAIISLTKQYILGSISKQGLFIEIANIMQIK